MARKAFIAALAFEAIMPEEENGETQRRIWFLTSVALIFAGIGFYGVWGMLFNTWNLFETRSLGAYAVTVLLLGFGIVGALLTKKKAAV
jgi:hypothetical protein